MEGLIPWIIYMPNHFSSGVLSLFLFRFLPQYLSFWPFFCNYYLLKEAVWDLPLFIVLHFLMSRVHVLISESWFAIDHKFGFLDAILLWLLGLTYWIMLPLLIDWSCLGFLSDQQFWNQECLYQAVSTIIMVGVNILSGFLAANNFSLSVLLEFTCS